MRAINAAIDAGNEQNLLEALENTSASLYNVFSGNIAWYLQNLRDEKAAKVQVCLCLFLVLWCCINMV